MANIIFRKVLLFIPDTLSSTPICKYKKNAYSLNEEWHDGPCRNCTCQNGGRTICREHQCAFCNDPVHVQDQCCPICKGKKNYFKKRRHPFHTVSGLKTL